MRSEVSLPKRLPLSTIPIGTRWMRIHARNKHALWFGPRPGGAFRMCYLATTIDVGFAETFLRNPPVRILGLDDLANRSIAIVEVRRELRLVPLHRPSLARLGTTADLASGNDYGRSQAWSRALWAHTDMPDGLAYRSRHDDSALRVALYNRARSRLAVVADMSLTKDVRLLVRLFKRYDVGLTRSD